MRKIGPSQEGVELLKAVNLPDVKFAEKKITDGVISGKDVVTAMKSDNDSFNDSFIDSITKYRH